MGQIVFTCPNGHTLTVDRPKGTRFMHQLYVQCVQCGERYINSVVETP